MVDLMVVAADDVDMCVFLCREWRNLWRKSW